MRRPVKNPIYEWDKRRAAERVAGDIDTAITSHEAAVDPHTGYRLESEDHTHQTTGQQAGKIDHGLALDGLADDDHPQYLLVANIDDVAVNGEVAAPISSNWAFDHVAAADPHTGYRLESADHTHQSTGAQAGKLDHGLALDGLGDDDHTQYAKLAGDTFTGTVTIPTLLVTTGIVINKASGSGLKVDTASPDYGWRDLDGHFRPKDTGGNRPTLSTFRGNIRSWMFIANDIVELALHIPHDYAQPTNIYIHTHWAHTGTNITGSLVIDYKWTYAQGHNQATFPSDTTLTQTVAGLTLAGFPQYQHITSEIQLSAGSPAGGQIDSDILEPDGMLLMQVTPTTIPTVTAGGFFITNIDIHYQSTSTATKNRTPSFYS